MAAKSSLLRLVALAYWVVASVWAGRAAWRSWRVGSTRVECTEGPCEEAMSQADLVGRGLGGAAGSAAGVLALALLVFAAAWLVLRMTRPKAASGV